MCSFRLLRHPPPLRSHPRPPCSSDCKIKLKAIREVKNHIIGNRTKKLSYVKLGAVPDVVATLAEADTDSGSNLIVHSAAALGSFACGVDAGVRAVLDAGASPHLIRPLSVSEEKVAALGAISNIVVDFTPRKSTFIQCGGIKELVQLTMSTDSSLRLNAVWSLRNMVFLAGKMCKEGILIKLTVSSVASLICDPEPSVQEQALALVCSFVDGCMVCVEYAFAEDGVIPDAVGKQLQKPSI